MPTVEGETRHADNKEGMQQGRQAIIKAGNTDIRGVNKAEEGHALCSTPTSELVRHRQATERRGRKGIQVTLTA